MLNVTDLTLGIGDRTLCSQLSFTVEPGQLWCVLGRNGCGKSTLLRTLAGLRAAQGGRIVLQGRVMSDWNWQELARTRALLPQHIRDAFSSTVLDTVLSARYPHRSGGLAARWGFDTAEDVVIAHDCLAALDLDELAARDVLSLSGGERQRVALAAVLAQQPRLALLDEPTAHLDLDVQSRVMRLLRQRVDAAPADFPLAALVSLHDVNLAERHATHVLLFDEDGSVLAGECADIMTAERLSAAFHHRVRQLSDGEHRWFVAE